MQKIILGTFFQITFFLAPLASALSPEQLEQKIAQKIATVEEFNFIRQTAKAMGLRVWLFGGTAAGYAHYVKWDSLRQEGDKRYQGDRFDYDFTNIYRSTQDLDIVADGTIQQIDEFATRLSNEYPHFLGGKAKWEVRTLRFSRGAPGEMGYKEALLNDYDFLNQNTDSNSTGMIEISKSREPVVRDLRDWNSQRSFFFTDVLNSHVHFYRSPRHDSTARAKAGNNPEIFSVIRALTKAFQYELTFTPQDEKEIQTIIDQFIPTEIKDNNSQRRLIDMGKKLIKHAVNIEYAWNTLERLGLRKKLMSFDYPTVKESLAWWMNKEPLRSYEVGLGNGKTAAELGIKIVAHESNTFLSYESITRAHTGDPNFLISREGFIGEAAAYGNGVYTRIGRQGAAHTGLTIRLKVNPQARLGTDFTMSSDYVIFHNKKAFTVIPESIDLSPLAYFELLNKGEAFPESERALLEKFKRKWTRSSQTSAGDLKKIRSFVADATEKWSKSPNSPLPLILQEFFSSAISEGSERELEKILHYNKYHAQLALLTEPRIVHNPKWSIWMKDVMSQKQKTALEILVKPGPFSHPEAPQMIDKIISDNQVSMHEAYIPLAYNSHIQQHPKFPEWIYKLIETRGYWGRANSFWAGTLKSPYILNTPYWEKTVKLFIDKLKHRYDSGIYQMLLSDEVTKNPSWLETVKYALRSLKEKHKVPETFLMNWSLPNWPEIIDLVIEEGYDLTSLHRWKMAPDNVPSLFEHPNWPDLFEKIITSYPPVAPSIFSLQSFIRDILGNPKAIRHPRWLDLMKHVLRTNPASNSVGIGLVLSEDHFRGQEKWYEFVDYALKSEYGVLLNKKIDLKYRLNSVNKLKCRSLF
ncbi:MAG: hypothetical protein A4S09_13635 [Proteobacteria bacterium SG_bin7]|nr:MAG: hypothetical protein A4S09_13635 [Proteobacteria bacterium SG_bin7]